MQCSFHFLPPRKKIMISLLTRGGPAFHSHVGSLWQYTVNNHGCGFFFVKICDGIRPHNWQSSEPAAPNRDHSSQQMGLLAHLLENPGLWFGSRPSAGRSVEHLGIAHSSVWGCLANGSGHIYCTVQWDSRQGWRCCRGLKLRISPKMDFFGFSLFFFSD